MAQVELLKLDESNYYSTQANIDYVSVSQVHDFMFCEFYGYMKALGKYVEEKTKPMLQGGYVDAYFSDRLEQFKQENPQIFKKDGTLLKDFEKANECIDTINNDAFFKGELKGQKQKILTGFIGDVPFKGALDFVDDEDITDLKCVASIKEKVWDNRLHKFVNFIIARRYDLQGGAYQELERQDTGIKKNFRLACVSKEENPDKAIIKLPQEMLDNALNELVDYVPRIDMIKKGLIAPKPCGNCPCCRKFNVLNRVVDYDELFGKEENDYDN